MKIKIITLLFTIAATGLCSAQGINLDWHDNTEADRSHYNVLRSKTVGGPYILVNPTTITLPLTFGDDGSTSDTLPVLATQDDVGALVTSSEYIDKSIDIGNVYFYRVTCVDHSGKRQSGGALS